MYFIIDSNSELVGEESSGAHYNNGTYMSTYYVHCHNTIILGGVVQTDNNTIDEQTDGKLLYIYHLICTWLHYDY